MTKIETHCFWEEEILFFIRLEKYKEIQKIEILLVLTNDRKNPDQTEATQRPEF
jgi:hypothetical protein